MSFCTESFAQDSGQVLLRTLLPASLDSLEGVHGKPGMGIACLTFMQSRLVNSPWEPGGQREADLRNMLRMASAQSLQGDAPGHHCHAHSFSVSSK